MNKTELIEKIAGKTGTTKVASGNWLDAFIQATEDEVKSGGSVVIPGFAKFDSVTRVGRSGTNPLNGKPYQTETKRVPKITAGALFKKALL